MTTTTRYLQEREAKVIAGFLLAALALVLMMLVEAKALRSRGSAFLSSQVAAEQARRDELLRDLRSRVEEQNNKRDATRPSDGALPSPTAKPVPLDRALPPLPIEKLVLPGTMRVRLEVHPPDSIVTRNGSIIEGREFVVNPKKPLTFQVERKGYITRDVTLNGSNSRVVVGLKRASPPNKK
jgi:hypothetical protein